MAQAQDSFLPSNFREGFSFLPPSLDFHLYPKAKRFLLFFP